MALSQEDKLALTIKNTNVIIENDYPDDWAILKHFIPTIKNPLVLWEYYKKILLALNIPIIEETIDKDLYIKDILDDDKLTQEEKDEDIAFRRKYRKEVIIWFLRKKFGEVLQIKDSTITMINDKRKKTGKPLIPERKLTDFGYTLDDIKTENIKRMKVSNLIGDLKSSSIDSTDETQSSSIHKIHYNLTEKDGYRRLEPIGSVNQNQSTQVYLPHKDIKNILRVQGRNSDIAHLLTELMESIIRYQSCAVYEATRIRTKAVISRQSCKIDELLAEMKESRKEAREQSEKLHKDNQKLIDKADDILGKLEDKKEVVKNTYNKGVLMVQFLDESDYDVPEGKYLIYLHGGKRSYWKTYETKEDKYYVMYKFETISDHDKAIRKIKTDMNIEPINPKRHLFALTEEQIDTMADWFQEWQDKNK